MGFVTSLFTGPLWKLGTIGAGILAMVLGGLLAHSSIENRSLRAQSVALEQKIDDPKTGYIAQVAQARTNVATLEVQLQTSNEKYQALSKQSEDNLAKSTAQLHAAQAQTAALQVKLRSFLATKPQGATLEDRINDIDHRAMSELVQ